MIDLSNYDTADLVAELERRDRKALESWYMRLEKEWEHKRGLVNVTTVDPCPNCDAVFEVMEGLYENRRVNRFQIRCPVCNFPGQFAKSENKAIELWNVDEETRGTILKERMKPCIFPL